MRKTAVLVLCCLAIALGVVGCGRSENDEVVPVEATTTQGNKVVFPSGDISWVDAVVSFTPGDPEASRSRDPKAALGAPDYQGTDDAQDETTYVSIGHGGELVLEFTDNVLVDGDGMDLAIYEIGPEVEPLLIAVSEDGEAWTDVGRVEGATCALDIGPFVEAGQRFQFVKLTDAKAGKSNDSQWPGADINAVGAINTSPVTTAQDG
jgi:OOP family OmpA-OmpF porin